MAGRRPRPDHVPGQVWRLVTPIFLHFGLLHILFNAWATTLEGTLIETPAGHAPAGDARAGLGDRSPTWASISTWTGPIPDGLHLFGGLSGVGYALFGYLWMKGQYEPEQGMILHPNTVTTMLIWLVLCMTGLVGPIANAAHVVGLLGRESPSARCRF